MLKELPHQRILLLLTGLVLIFITTTTAHAQIRAASPVRVGDSITCHVGKKIRVLTPDTRRIRITGNSGEIQEIFDEVSRHSNLTTYVYTVPVIEADVNVEICPGEVNYIAYRAEWLLRLHNDTRNKWAVYAVIAHEIGHYALGHDRNSVGSNHKIELEADEYAGEVLAKMNVSLEDAQAAFRSRLMNPTDETHPPINQRLMAVKKGWEKVGTISSTPQVDLSPVDLSQVHLKIDVLGQLNTIHILPAPSPSLVNAGQFMINFQNQTKTFYLEYGKVAEVNLYGQNNKVYISPQLSNRVRVTQHGQNNEVIIR